MRFQNLPLLLCASALAATALTGCATGPSASPAAAAGIPLKGNVHGGQQPVVGAHVYLMAANTTGYGAASLSLLTAATLHSDAIGNYVLTGADGSFSITGDYTCTAGQQVYLYALGGNPGAGVNLAAGFMSVIGNCPGGTFSPLSYYFINEVSTVAAAYSMAGFAIDATHVSSSGSTAAKIGIANAFLNAANLVSPSTGTTLTVTPAGNGNVPLPNLNTVGNILASCVNSSGPSSPNCAKLFANANSGGSSPITPTDTASAAINIAHNPAANVTALYSIATANSPYPFSLAQQPQDFTLGIDFSGGGLNQPYSLAIDGSGNVWLTNLGTRAVTKLSSTGVALSPSIGYTAFLTAPVGIAIDLNGNAWVADATANKLTEFSPTGAVLSPFPVGYTGGGLNAPQGIAIDGSNNIWTPNGSGLGSVSEFSNAGTPLSPATGFQGGGINGPFSIAVDNAGGVWNTNTKNNPSDVSKLNLNGTPISPATGFFGGGINRPYGVAIDAAGSAWIANNGGNSVSKLANDGSVLSPSNGFTNAGFNQPYGIEVDGTGNIWVANFGNSSVGELSNNGTVLSPANIGFTGGTLSNPTSVSVDLSGNVWVANEGSNVVTQLIGAASPRITPLALGIKNGTSATRP